MEKVKGNLIRAVQLSKISEQKQNPAVIKD
jgi:hypothetical protein